ncbi:MAG: glycoside hydrolase family 99-like domain-containing protein [Bacteroidales bacterium]|jgi:hypothetical protein|nr:glycoside hydrolase family 99-like domain-containing protein [Bacteroidales bacterium]
MKRIRNSFILLLLLFICCKSRTVDADKVTVACYYFPNYHTRDTTDLCISRQHFENWSEWELAGGYPYSNTIGNNTPENFKTVLQMTKDKLLSEPDGLRILNINCWNEWTEGSYLEPDTKTGMAYLNAVRDVFYP